MLTFVVFILVGTKKIRKDIDLITTLQIRITPKEVRHGAMKSWAPECLPRVEANLHQLLKER